MFAHGSRYDRTPEAVHVDAAGRARPYKLLRELPPPAPAAQVHELADGERLDLVAFRYYGDPEQFWRIADAARALRPQDLEAPGTRLPIVVVTR